MQPTKSETEKARAQVSQFTKHYRAIGPAAIVAALMHIKKRKPAQAASPKAA